MKMFIAGLFILSSLFVDSFAYADSRENFIREQREAIQRDEQEQLLAYVAGLIAVSEQNFLQSHLNYSAIADLSPVRSSVNGLIQTISRNFSYEGAACEESVIIIRSTQSSSYHLACYRSRQLVIRIN